jgi:hypothetical protein
MRHHFLLSVIDTPVYSVIAFRFIPNSFVTQPVGAVWVPFVQDPWYRLPRTTRLTIGWIALLGLVCGAAFGFPLTGVSVLRTKLMKSSQTSPAGYPLFRSRDFPRWAGSLPDGLLGIVKEAISNPLVGQMSYSYAI